MNYVCRLLQSCLVLDECGQSGVDSDEDVITDYLPAVRLSPDMAQRTTTSGGPLVPTISVTPHSPAAKYYPVLGQYDKQNHPKKYLSTTPLFYRG